MLAFADSDSSYRQACSYAQEEPESQEEWVEMLKQKWATLDEREGQRDLLPRTSMSKFMAANFLKWASTDATTRYRRNNNGWVEWGERYPTKIANNDQAASSFDDWKIIDPTEGDETYLIYKLDVETAMASNTRYRDLESIENAVYVSKMNKYTEEDGSVYYSKLPKNIIDHFGSCLDLTALTLQPQVGSVMKQIARRQSSYARNDKFSGWRGNTYNSDIIGDVSFCTAEDTIPGSEIGSWADLVSETPGSINVFELSSLYRGGDGNVKYKKKQTRISHLYNKKNIFLYAAQFTILNHETLTWETAKIINVMVTIPIEQVFKYKRARDFFPQFLKNIFDRGGLMFTDPQEYYRIVRERFGRNMTYWDGLKTVFSDVENVEMEYKSYISESEPVDDSHLRHLQYYTEISNNSKVAEYNRALENKEEIEKTISTSRSTISTNERSISSNEERIKQYLSYIEEFTEQIETYTTENSKAERKIQGLEPALEELDSVLSTLSKENDDTIEMLLNGSLELEIPKFIQNLSKSGIIVDEIKYIIPGMAHIVHDDFNKSAGSSNAVWNNDHDAIYMDTLEDIAVVSIKDSPNVALMARLKKSFCADEAYENTVDGLIEKMNVPVELKSKDFVPKIYQIQFHTTKPVIIRVDYGKDGDDCKKVVGGPYRVKLDYGVPRRDNYDRNRDWMSSSPSLSVALASTDACFGIDSGANKYWVHPHTNYNTYSTNTWETFSHVYDYYGSACLGEASPTLYKAYEDSDIKTAIFGAMTWITSANSSDQWGRSYNKFPKLSNVNMSGEILEEQEEEESKILTTEEGMENIAEDLASIIEDEETLDLETAPVIIPDPPAAECFVPRYLPTQSVNDEMQALAQALNPIDPAELVPDRGLQGQVIWREIPQEANIEETGLIRSPETIASLPTVAEPEGYDENCGCEECENYSEYLTTDNAQQELRSAGVPNYVSYAQIRNNN